MSIERDIVCQDLKVGQGDLCNLQLSRCFPRNGLDKAETCTSKIMQTSALYIYISKLKAAGLKQGKRAKLH